MISLADEKDWLVSEKRLDNDLCGNKKGDGEIKK